MSHLFLCDFVAELCLVLPPRFPVLSPLVPFCTLPRLCPHQSHLHTISGLSGLAPKHGYCCTRCAQRKWPPVLIPPLDSLKDPLKPPQPLLLPSLDASTDRQKRGVLDGVLVNTHHTRATVPNAGRVKEEGSDEKENKEGEVTVLSVGRWGHESLVHPFFSYLYNDWAHWHISLILTAAISRLPFHLNLCSGRFQVAQIPEHKPAVVELNKTSSQEQRSSLFLGKPFCSTLTGIMRYDIFSHTIINASAKGFTSGFDLMSLEHLCPIGCQNCL